MENTRQIKPEVAEPLRSRTANFNPFTSVVDLKEALIGAVCVVTASAIQVRFSRKHPAEKNPSKNNKMEYKPL